MEFQNITQVIVRSTSYTTEDDVLAVVPTWHTTAIWQSQNSRENQVNDAKLKMTTKTNKQNEESGRKKEVNI